MMEEAMDGTMESANRMHVDVALRPADPRDGRAVRRLLHESALPLDGVEEFFPAAYVVAVSREEGIVGVAGLETHGPDGLLRSVAVAPVARGRGIGEALVRDRLDFARRRDLESVHLLTTTAARWFDRLGFRRADRAALPAAIRESVEFTSACPESATAMSRPVSDAGALRGEIRARYASAAKAARTGPSSCCGSGSSCGGSADRAPAGLALRPEGLGYAAADVATLPEQAVQASLGCGNPLLLAELREGEKVLDLGSGGGIDVLLSARRVGPKGWAWGVDMTDEMLSLARENQRAAGVENATFLRGTIESVPLPEASVDVVISNCVINLSTDKAKTIAEAHRVLRPGGRFAVADIVTTHPMPPAAQRAAALWAGCVAGAMTIDEYRRTLADAGFVDVEIEPVQAVGGDSACCGAGDVAPELAAWEGKVLSAFVRAVKPA
jgi:N-acetylglutamate synthase-like GNAT family acetyltransferase/SAM-dependent methyltransferase